MKKNSKAVSRKKADRFTAEEMRRGVMGKYAAKREDRSPVRAVILDADLAKVFPDSESVNNALRAIVTAFEGAKKRKKTA